MDKYEIIKIFANGFEVVVAGAPTFALAEMLRLHFLADCLPGENVVVRSTAS
jgi:hypothetical protein